MCVTASDDIRRPVGPDAKYVIKVVSCYSWKLYSKTKKCFYYFYLNTCKNSEGTSV